MIIAMWCPYEALTTEIGQQAHHLGHLHLLFNMLITREVLLMTSFEAQH